ncbi:hypothetical protein [Streptomyces sp. NPDC001480]
MESVTQVRTYLDDTYAEQADTHVVKRGRIRVSYSAAHGPRR